MYGDLVVKGVRKIGRVVGRDSAQAVEEARAHRPGVMGRVLGGLGTAEGIVEQGLDAAGSLVGNPVGRAAGSRGGLLGAAAGMGAGALGAFALAEELKEIVAFAKLVGEMISHPDKALAAFDRFLGGGPEKEGQPVEAPRHGAGHPVSRTSPVVVEPVAVARTPAELDAGNRDAPLNGSAASSLAKELPSLEGGVTLHVAGQGRDVTVGATSSDFALRSVDEGYARIMQRAAAQGVPVTAGSRVALELLSPAGAVSHANVEVVDASRYRVIPGEDGHSAFTKPRGFEEPSFVAAAAAVHDAAGGAAVVDARQGVPGAPGGVVARLTTIQVGSQMDDQTLRSLNSAGRYLGGIDGPSVSRIETGVLRLGAATDTTASFVSDGVEGGLRSLKVERDHASGASRLVLTQGLPGGSGAMEASREIEGGGIRKSLVLGLAPQDLSVGPGGVAKLSAGAGLALETAGKAAGSATDLEKATEALGPGRRSSIIFDRTSGRAIHLVEGEGRAVALSSEGLFVFSKGANGVWHMGKAMGTGAWVDAGTGRAHIPENVLRDVQQFAANGRVSMAIGGEQDLTAGVMPARAVVDSARAASERLRRTDPNSVLTPNRGGREIE